MKQAMWSKALGGEVVKLHAVRVHQATKKFVNREGESPVHKVDEADALVISGTGSYLVAGSPRLHLLQRRHVTVAAQRLRLALGHGGPLPVAVNFLQIARRVGGGGSGGGGPGYLLLPADLLHHGAAGREWTSLLLSVLAGRTAAGRKKKKDELGGENGDFFSPHRPYISIYPTGQVNLRP